MFELEAQGFSLAHLGSRQAMPILIHEFRVLGLVEESIVFFFGGWVWREMQVKRKELGRRKELDQRFRVTGNIN